MSTKQKISIAATLAAPVSMSAMVAIVRARVTALSNVRNLSK